MNLESITSIAAISPVFESKTLDFNKNISQNLEIKLPENIDLKALIQVALQRYSRIKRISSIFNPNSITRIKAW